MFSAAQILSRRAGLTVDAGEAPPASLKRLHFEDGQFKMTLTEAAEAYFPKRYDRLATNLLASIAQIEGQEGVRSLVDHMATGMAAEYLPRVAGKPLPERVVALAAVAQEGGGGAGLGKREEQFFFFDRLGKQLRMLVQNVLF